MAEKNGEFGAFLSGFLMGALVGGAIALLLAPMSGEETRTMIMDKSIELKEKTKDGVSDLQKRGQVVLEDQKSRKAKKQDVPEEGIIVDEIDQAES